MALKLSDQPSCQSVLAFAAAGALAFFLTLVALPHCAVTAQQQTVNTTTTTTTGGTSEIMDLAHQPLMVVVDNEPFYQTTSSNITGVRIVDVSPSVVIQEVSFIDRAFIENIGNVTNTGTFIDNIDHDGARVHGVGKGIITIEDGGDMISWNSYDLGLTVYGNGNNTGGGGLDTEKITTTYRGIVFFNTNSERLSFLNNVIGLYITQVINGHGSGLGQIWEWRTNY